MAQCDESTRFEDNVLKVKYVPLRPSTDSGEISEPQDFAQIQEDNIDYYAHERKNDTLVVILSFYVTF